jgi:phage terminase large subunit
MAANGQWRITRVFEETVRGDERFVFNEGGTRSGKTIAILQVLHWTMEMNPNQNLIISVVSETMPHLRRGAMLDYFDRLLKPAGLYDPANHNKTDNSYTVNGNRIEFFSADSSDKVHGPGRDILYFNELQNTNFDTFFHLVQRTRLKIYADWNPTHEFFVHTKFLNNPDYDSKIKYIHSTYKDNPYLPMDIVRDILNRAKYDENYRLVYVEGKIGVKEGVIFDFEQVDEIPEGEYVYGLDFGYTNDPTAVVRVLITGEAIYMDEVLYQRGLTNREIADALIGKLHDYDEIFADSAEPKSIDDIFSMGLNIKPAIKGEINWGIDVMKRYQLCITKHSLNLIKEFRNYTWAVNKNGEPIGKPIDTFNHGIDAVRYAVTNRLQAMTDYKTYYEFNTENRL